MDSIVHSDDNDQPPVSADLKGAQRDLLLFLETMSAIEIDGDHFVARSEGHSMSSDKFIKGVKERRGVDMTLKAIEDELGNARIEIIMAIGGAVLISEEITLTSAES
jgi:hypothetical protein